MKFFVLNGINLTIYHQLKEQPILIEAKGGEYTVHTIAEGERGWMQTGLVLKSYIIVLN